MQTITREKKKTLDEIIESHDRKSSFLIEILQDVQDEYNYLPEDILKKLSREMNVSRRALYYHLKKKKIDINKYR